MARPVRQVDVYCPRSSPLGERGFATQARIRLPILASIAWNGALIGLSALASKPNQPETSQVVNKTF
jgi:hypothetical protein